ncbi:FAD-dependent oxidoreductase [Candidatus Sumerlaeota bacterium]|nr:FAD-dependent oxidoreductase [Candidatus Sumerlaeota bacterium]
MSIQQSHTEVLIIGGGPAGISFCRKLKKLKPEKKITALRPEKRSMVYCAIPYALEGLFDHHKTLKRDELITDTGAILIQRSAKEIDLQAKRVVDEAGDVYTADVIFIATGARNMIPPIEGVDAKNIHTVKTQDDMERLLLALDNGARRAIVIGAGAIGIEQAQAYRARGLEVFLVDMASRVLPAMLDEDMAEPLHETLRTNGINLTLSSRVARIEKKEGKANRVVLSKGNHIDLDPENDFICLAVGMSPDVELFKNQGLEMNKDGIIVDSRMRTNIPGVYAAGDCCSFFSGIDKKPISGKLATNAVPMAKIAARVVAGKDDEYPGFFNGAATCVYDYRIGSTGFTKELARQRGIEPVIGWGETTALFPMMPNSGKIRVKIVADVKDLRVIGGQIVSSLPATDKTDIITLAIQRGLTLKGLSKLSYSAQPWQSFMPAQTSIVQACENALDSFMEKNKEIVYPDVLECV